jgi:lysophospholipase L1-like esterase
MKFDRIKSSFFGINILAPFIFSFMLVGCGQKKSTKKDPAMNFFAANNPHIRYVGRVDFSNPKKPRIWAPGAYIKVRFKGPSLKLLVKNETADGKKLNYLEVVVDHHKPHRMQLSSISDTVTIAKGLKNKAYTATIIKDTEGSSYIEIEGFRTGKLLSLGAKPDRKIQFIGDSITCGYGNDTSQGSCDEGDWYDHENAYMSFGPIAARRLHAQWTLASVSGIGMIHSSGGMKITMPQVYGNIDMHDDSISMQFGRTPPDVVAICLGQNDGIQDSTDFTGAYVKFIKRLRKHYPKAQIVCLTSPMADTKLNAVLQNYLTGIVQKMHQKGDEKVSKYFFSKRYNNGCHGHPTIKQDKNMAKEVSSYIAGLMHW